MDRERTYALIIRLGAPQHLDYATSRGKPFWRLREAIMFRLYEAGLDTRWHQCVAQLKSAAQGYPGNEVNVKASEVFELAARRATREVGVLLMPWLEWPAVESAKDRATRELGGESQDLIRAWIARFEPENLQQYHEHLAQRAGQRNPTNAG